MEALNRNYDRVASTPSDINEHLPTLRRYAAACPTGRVAEMGVRGVVSTWALLAGLVAGQRHTPHLPGGVSWCLPTN